MGDYTTRWNFLCVSLPSKLHTSEFLAQLLKSYTFYKSRLLKMRIANASISKIYNKLYQTIIGLGIEVDVNKEKLIMDAKGDCVR